MEDINAETKMKKGWPSRPFSTEQFKVFSFKSENGERTDETVIFICPDQDSINKLISTENKSFSSPNHKLPLICISLGLCLALLGIAIVRNLDFRTIKQNVVCDTEICKKVGEEIKDSMDMSATPCQDFYQYACGGWIERGLNDTNDTFRDALNEVTKRNAKLIRDFLASSENFGGAFPAAQNFYFSCLDKDKITTTVERSYEITKEKVLDDADDDYGEDDGWDFVNEDVSEFHPVIQNDLKSFADIEDDEETTSLLCASTTQKFFPDVTARIFVQKMFPIEKEAKVKRMLNEVQSMYMELITNDLSWLDSKTKAYIKRKISQTVLSVGYPVSVLDVVSERFNYLGIDISREGSEYFQNVEELENLSNSKIQSIFSSDNTPYVTLANAFYAFSNDELFIPAGISQEPFFHLDYPEIVNYAKFATTLGHEYTHAFEHYLNPRTIWDILEDKNVKSESVSTKSWDNFNNLTACLEDQYGSFEVLNDSFVNGLRTWNENLSDNIGLQLAFKLFMKHHSQNYLSLPGLEMLSMEQLFFVSAAQVECRSFSSEEKRKEIIGAEITLGSHSPNSIRVLGEMINSEDFAKAFQCPLGSRYNPHKKCSFLH